MHRRDVATPVLARCSKKLSISAQLVMQQHRYGDQALLIEAVEHDGTSLSNVSIVTGEIDGHMWAPGGAGVFLISCAKLQARPPRPGIWDRDGGARDPGGQSRTPGCDVAPGRTCDVITSHVITSHGGRGPGTDGGQVRGERRRARRGDAEMRGATSGAEVENDGGQPVDPLPGGDRKPCWVTDLLTFVG